MPAQASTWYVLPPLTYNSLGWGFRRPAVQVRVDESNGCGFFQRFTVGASLFFLLIGGGCLPPPELVPPRAPRTAREVPVARKGPTRSVLVGTVLPSGLRLLLDEDPNALAAGVVAVVVGGSAKDPPGAEGLAHLVEHLSYRAVDPRGPGERPLTRSDRLIKYGATETNGFTSHDWLMFYEFGPPARLGDLIQLEGERLTNPLLGVEEPVFAVEREVIGSEHLLRSDPRAGGWASNTFFPTLFVAPHPYARPLGGTEESRRKLTLQQARVYATEQFVPQKITLLVSAPPGATSLEAIAARLPARLQGDAKHPVDRSSQATPAPGASVPPPAVAPGAGEGAPAVPSGDGLARGAPPRVQRKHSPLPTTELWLGWTLPGAYGEGEPMMEVLPRWVQQDLDAGVLAQEDPHIRYVAATLQPGREASVLFVRVLVSDGANPERIAQVVSSRVSTIWAREPVSQEFFAGVRGLYETQQLLEKPGQLPRSLQEAVDSAVTESVRSSSRIFAAVQALKSTAVAQFAYQNLTQGRGRAVLFTPASSSPSAEEARPPSFSGGGGSNKLVSELVPGAATWDVGDLSTFLPRAWTVKVKPLSTGLTLLTVRRPGAAVVAWLAFRGGYSDADPPLTVELALRTRPEAQNAPKLQILPGRGATRDMSFDIVEFQPGQLVNGLTLLFAKATAPVKDWPAREGLQRILAPLAAGEDGKAIQAGRAFWRALLGEHPFARVVATADLDNLTRSDIDAWLGRVHQVRNAALVVVGDVDPAEVERGAIILSRQLKTPTWVPELPAPPAPLLRPANSEHIVPVITGRPGSLTEIRLGCLLPPLAVADRGHYELLRYAIEARLNGAMRVDHGDGYGVNVDYERLRGGTTYLVAATFVSEQSLPRSLATIRGHWQRWSRSGFEATEVNVARWKFAGALPLAFASGHKLAYDLLNEWNAEPAALSREDRRPSVSTLRVERVNELFATCKANAVLAVTGNEASIRRAVDRTWPDLNARGQRSSH